MVMVEVSTDNSTPFLGLTEFLFDAPLYKTFVIPKKEELNSRDPLRGYCPYCENWSLFTKVHRFSTHEWTVAMHVQTSRDIDLKCGVDATHLLRFNILFRGNVLWKIGQWPTFATIARGRLKDKIRVLSHTDATELAKAVGLASHDAGIGAYVYVRRVFERVLWQSFNEFRKTHPEWTDEKFQSTPTDKRIELLRGELPDYLVQNAKLYSILSLGMHELNEQQCLDFFDAAYEAVLYILEDKINKKEEAAQRNAASKAIAAYELKIERRKAREAEKK
jgi:hypothetical protein